MKKCQPRLLTPFIDGELAPEARGDMEEHLQSCPTCGAMLDEVTEAYLHVRQMGRATIPMTALQPAVELFAERAGLELGAPRLRDTIEIAREPEPPTTAHLDDDLPEPIRPRALTEPKEPGVEGITWADEPGAEPTAEAENPLPADEPGVLAVPEPMAAPPAVLPTEATDGVSDEAPPEAAEVTDEEPAWPAATPPGEPDESEQMELAASEVEPVDFHAEAPPDELRPPWLSQAEVEETTLEADGRAAVDDAIEREAEGAADEDPGAAAALPAEDDADDLEADDLSPRDPIPDPEPVSRPEPRLEPPPEPWSTVWRPSRVVDDESAARDSEALTPEPQDAVSEFEPPPATAEVESAAPDHPGLETRGTGWSGEDQPMPEVEEAVARLRGDLREGIADPEPVHYDDDLEGYGSIEEYRSALQERREPRPGFLGLDLGRRSDQVKVAAVAALILLLLVGATAVALTSNRQATSTTATQTQPSAAASAPATQASIAPSPAASPAAASAIPQLASPISAGAGGIGWTATKIRGGSPGSGITRIVIELSGAGATPTVRLGRGPDGAAYLVSSGISADPAVVQAFKSTGLVTAISQVGSDGMGLKITLSGSPQYAMTYLSSPTRLVIDFK